MAVALVVIILTVSLVSCNGDATKGGGIYSAANENYLNGTRPSDNLFVSESDIVEGSYVNEYKNRTKVGYNAEYLGTTTRKLAAATGDEGLVKNGTIAAYPKYGSNSPYNEDQRKAVIAENNKLISVNTRVGNNYQQDTFDRMDEAGNLYLKGEATGKKLYKHVAADGMYNGNVSDAEPAIVKRLTYNPRANGTSYNVTGVYAPAGEVIKIEISEADMQATGGIEVLIGQALYNKKANNIWAARQINRMPVILNTMVVNSVNSSLDKSRGVYTAYVGSFFGGPIYIYNESVKFSVTISGGVRYAHYILGYTTPEEYEQNLKSSAPYFDLEVRENGVLHSGPKSALNDMLLQYDNIYKAAELWEKISLVSTQRNGQGIVFIYDPFVAAGAAVAFPGQMSVNCPSGWMSGSLNYDSFVSSGAWGNIHEYNHNFQGYGCGDDGEVTNNALSLAEYTLFTNISSARKMGNYGAQSLSGWNTYTSATWALNRIKTGEINSTNGLAVYATLIHNLGQEAFIKASLGGRDLNYFKKWGEVTHQNMSYYTKLVSKFATADYSELNSLQSDYPMFVPVSSVYQTGRSYMYDGVKRYISTMQPYNINFGEVIDIDLREYTELEGVYKYGSIVIPDGFSFKIKKITSPQNGEITKKSDYIYSYMPGTLHPLSGKIVVTLSITKDDGAFKVDDVDLVLEFKQSHEMNKSILTRTVYTYESGAAPASSTAAFESGFEGAKVETMDNVNPTQNGNAEVWSNEVMQNNTFYEVSGKLYIAETGKYRIALRGRWDCALYISVNGQGEYKHAATINTIATHANFYPNEPQTYHDAEYEAGDWVYFRAVLKGEHKNGKNAFIGVGIGQFVKPQGTIDDNGNFVDGNGNIIDSTKETVTISYANAYRTTYEKVDEEFTSDYFFLRDYRYTYRSDEVEYFTDGQSIDAHDFVHWSETYKIDNLFDGNPNTTAHSAKHVDGQPETYVNAAHPFNLSVALDEQITANTFIVYERNDSNNKTGMPIDFKLELYDKKDGKLIAEKTFTSVKHTSGINVQVALGEYFTFGYYKLTVTRCENDYFASSAIGFAAQRLLESGTVFEADNRMFTYDGKWVTSSGLYTFGHIYEGVDGATLKFTFTGSAFAVFGYKGTQYGSFEVLIDGKSVGTVSQNGKDNGSEMVFLSDDLGSGRHTVEIKCNSGISNIDNIVLWK